jgi:hypothetical protein
MSGQTLRQWLRRYRPNGPHAVCYHCDRHVDTTDGRCPSCGEDHHIAPCIGPAPPQYGCARCNDGVEATL